MIFAIEAAQWSSTWLGYCLQWTTATKRTISLFYYVRFNSARLWSESTGGAINQKVSILLAMAAGATNTTVHINNRPNSWASQRTYKGRRRRWIRQQFGITLILCHLRFMSLTEVLWSTWLKLKQVFFFIQVNTFLFIYIFITDGSSPWFKILYTQNKWSVLWLQPCTHQQQSVLSVSIILSYMAQEAGDLDHIDALVK